MKTETELWKQREMETATETKNPTTDAVADRTHRNVYLSQQQQQQILKSKKYTKIKTNKQTPNRGPIPIVLERFRAYNIIKKTVL